MTEYVDRNGLPCIKSGEVIINGAAHKVENFFVKCDASLNCKAWNTTAKVSFCNKCFHCLGEKPVISKAIQLSLFE